MSRLKHSVSFQASARDAAGRATEWVARGLEWDEEWARVSHKASYADAPRGDPGDDDWGRSG